ncbi:MAG TPA: hypothetical protein DCY13_12245 [Verrucomicrobiales bacterium]|nr:hypothetical protein [Verrucomicrobiales bacterium]
MAGKGGGAWKVAYADFVTAMMALFLVLWLTAQSPQIKQAVARSFTNPFASPEPPRTGVLDQSEDAVDNASSRGQFSMTSTVELNVLKRLSQQLIEALNSSAAEDLSSVVQMRIEEDYLRITVFDKPSHPVFEPGSQQLTEFGHFIFTTLSWQIAHYPRRLGVDLEGHTLVDERTGRPDEGPWELSLDRANTVRRLLLDYQVPEERIRNVSGYGGSQPLNKQEPGDAANRRVSMILKLR